MPDRSSRLSAALCKGLTVLLMTCAGLHADPPAAEAVEAKVPLRGLFEVSLTNEKRYVNPFADVELNAEFTSPSGRKVSFFGFYDGDGKGGQDGSVWRQRFMPDEVGTWSYELSFSDGSPGRKGQFECVAEGGKPGPWRPDPENPHWFKTFDDRRFLPIAMLANCRYTPIDWKDAIDWCKARGYNTLITFTLNTYDWPAGYPNVTAFATRDLAKKEVDYDRMNIAMWREWDEMIQTAGRAGIYVGPFNGPSGRYGGQRQGYPPKEMVFLPQIDDRFDSPRNRRILRYMVARQGAFWNLAYWTLHSTELFEIMGEREAVAYGEYFASITPFGRMITSQDSEQVHGKERHWISHMKFPVERKFNTVQTGTGNPNNPAWQEARINNALALGSYHGFPVMTTEGLWEGQGRARKPLRIIWGFYAAGAHVVWADWSYEHGAKTHRWGSIGKGWVPVRPIAEHCFRVDQLGVDCTGDEELRIATDYLLTLEYWKMNPDNRRVAGSTEAYCLAEPGRRYTIYAPRGGTVKLDLKAVEGTFDARWLDPRAGGFTSAGRLTGGDEATLEAPDTRDWVLDVALRK